MSQPLSRRALVAALGLVLAAPAARAQEGVVVVPVAPPPPRREFRPHRPRDGLVWQPGFWRWEGGRHVWVEGAWVEPPRPRAAWVAGHWGHRPGGWVWIPGHWA